MATQDTALCDMVKGEMAAVQGKLRKLRTMRNTLRRASSMLSAVPNDVASLLPSAPALPTSADLVAAAQQCSWNADQLPSGFGATSTITNELKRSLRGALQSQIRGALSGPVGRGMAMFAMGSAALAAVNPLMSQLAALDQCLSGACADHTPGVALAEFTDEFKIDSFGNPLIAIDEAAQAKASAAKNLMDDAMVSVNAWL